MVVLDLGAGIDSFVPCRMRIREGVKTAEGADFYDKTPTAHEHALCSVCGKLIDTDLGDFEALLRERADIPLLSYDLILHTVCPDCGDSCDQNH